MRRARITLVTALAMTSLGGPALAQTDTTPPTATITLGSSPVGDPVVSFDEAVGPVPPGSITWDLDGVAVNHRRRCLDEASGTTSCSGTRVRSVLLLGYTPLPIGARQAVAVNEGSDKVTDTSLNAAPAARTERRVTAAQEERGPAVAASWLRFQTSDAIGGAFRAERASDMVATYWFSGDQITWITREGPKDGVARLSVDGRSLGTVDNSAAKQRFGVERRFSGFGAGPHLLVIRVLDAVGSDGRGPWIVVEGFRSALGTAFDGSATYRWSNQRWRGASGSRVSRSATKGADMRIPFWGGGIDWWAGTGPQEGIVEVLVDGRRYRTVDNSASSQGRVRRRVTGFDAGPHMLKLRVSGKPGSDGRGRTVTVDRFSVRPSVTMFKGLGAWIDLFDYDGGMSEAQISSMTESMAGYGVRTLYLETARYNSDGAFDYPAKIVYWLAQAHARGIEVVGWYFPADSATLDIDVPRSIAIANYRSPRGDRFDALGIDIEYRGRDGRVDADGITQLLRRVRNGIGVTYPMSAIPPPPNQMDLAPSSWAGFPWSSLGRYADAIQPMAYSSYRKGNQCPTGASRDAEYCTRAYTSNAVSRTRTAIENDEVVIHVIGGIADRITDTETRDFVTGASDAYGASLYDYRTTRASQWPILAGIS